MVRRSVTAVAEAASPRLGTRVGQSWRITYPLIVASLSPIVLSLADTVILGHYSTEALAAIGLVLPVYLFAMAAITPWGTAVQTLVAQWTGAGDHTRINRILDVGLGFIAAIAAAVSLLLLALSAVIVDLIGGTAPPPDSLVALRILLLCLPFAAVTAHYRGVFGGLGQTGIAMRVALLVNLTNIPFDYLLVFGLDLGALGSATGTLLATVLGAVYIVWYGRRRLGGQYRFWRRTNLARPKQIIAPLTRIGWPDMTFVTIAYGADILLVSLVARLGEVPLAGYRLMVTTVTVLWVVVFCTSNGISILAGQRLGAGDLPGVAAFRRSGAAMMTVLATAVALPPLLVPDWFFGLFTPDAAVVGQARSVVWLLAGMVPAMLLGMSIAGVLRGAGDTKSVMYAGLAGQLGFTLPVAWLLAVHFDHGLVGVYAGFLAGWLVRATVTWLRYRTGRWATAVPPRTD